MTSFTWLRFLQAIREHATPRKERRNRKASPGKKLFLEPLEERTVLSPYIVTTTADSGPGSLRDAITQVNADTNHTLYASATNPSVDEIDFAVTAASDTGGGYNATTGVATIAPLTALPTITNSVVINGYTQAGASSNTHAMTDPDPSDNAVLKIELNGSNEPLNGTNGNVPLNGIGLTFDDSGGNTVRGLAINDFSAYGIWLAENVANAADIIAGNFIGTDVTGTVAKPNSTGPLFQYNTPNGAVVVNSGNNVIGGTDPASRNLISGNAADGLVIEDSFISGAVTGNLVEGNFIGTDVTGTKPLGNVSPGAATLDAPGNVAIRYAGTLNTTIGGTTPGARNVISACANASGITFGGSGGLIEGNFIGTDVTGRMALGNADSGVDVRNGTNVTVGGAAAGAGNVISANSFGVSSGASSGTVIEGNYIGTDLTGGNHLGNGSGIFLYSFHPGDSATIGGTAPGAGNVISGNGLGIRMQGASGNVVEGNLIGTDVSGKIALGNGTGMFLDGETNDTIGGTAAGARNVISGNGDGIDVLNNAASNVIQGNYIGTDISGQIALPNGGDGVEINSGASDNTVGGTTAAAGNIISGNGGRGIDIAGSDNLVQGNYIGTDVTGTQAIGNRTNGVLVESGANNTIGGTGTGVGNTIANNGGAGVSVTGSFTTGNAIRGNSIYDNGGLGIDLGGSGVPVLNDSQGHSGPNNFQDFPILASAITNKGGVTIIAGSFNSPLQPNTTITVDFYANAAKDASGYGEGQIDLGSLTFTTDSKGVYTIHSFKPSAAVPVGYYVTATATDSAGNTSEFGPDVLVTTPQMASHGNALTAASSGSSGTGTTGGALVPEDLAVYVDNSNSDLTADELARIQEAVASANAVIEPYGATIAEVTDPTLADVTLNMDTTSAVGGYADGVLGCTTDAGQITLINGWNFYAGSDATQIGSDQYDFETAVTHELGHAFGLGHSTDSTSVMYATLNTGTVNRTLTTADLNVADSDPTGACGLHAAAVSAPAGAKASTLSTTSFADPDDYFVSLMNGVSTPGLAPNALLQARAHDAVFAEPLGDVGASVQAAPLAAENASPIFGGSGLSQTDDELPVGRLDARFDFLPADGSWGTEI